MRHGYYAGSDGCVTMHDLGHRRSLANAKIWKDEVLAVCGPIPVVSIGMKTDLGPHNDHIQGVTNFLASSRHGEGLWEPLLYLARQVTGIADLERSE